MSARTWWVLWCGRPCYGSPFATEADARAWLDRAYESARAAKSPIIGDYRIVQSEVRP